MIKVHSCMKAKYLNLFFKLCLFTFLEIRISESRPRTVYPNSAYDDSVKYFHRINVSSIIWKKF